MKITYYGTTGQVRMVYKNIATYSYSGNVVILDREENWTDATAEVNVPPSYSTYTRRQVAAIIHLAPGEYLERSNDAERD